MGASLWKMTKSELNDWLKHFGIILRSERCSVAQKWERMILLRHQTPKYPLIKVPKIKLSCGALLFKL